MRNGSPVCSKAQLDYLTRIASVYRQDYKT